MNTISENFATEPQSASTARELQKEIAAPTQLARELIAESLKPITSAAQYAAASDLLIEVKTVAKKLDEREKEITRPINASLKAIRDLFRGPKDLCMKAEMGFKRSMLAYQRNEEEKRLAAQRAAEELARKERERLARLAVQAEQRGATEKAAEFAAREAAIVVPVISIAAPKTAGITTRKDYTFEIVDETQLPREYLSPDESKIRKEVRAKGVGTNIPGVRVIEREILAARAGT